MAEQNSKQAIELRAAVFTGDDKAKVAARRAAGIHDERRITRATLSTCGHAKNQIPISLSV
jgi:hypothetical protein